jgi:hypothetical protein
MRLMRSSYHNGMEDFGQILTPNFESILAARKISIIPVYQSTITDIEDGSHNHWCTEYRMPRILGRRIESRCVTYQPS